jgi:hypothetical protein
MKTRLLVMLAATLISGTAVAGGREDIQTLADQSGLTPRKVRMVLGTPTAFPEYRTSYVRSKHKLMRAVGGLKQLEDLAARYREEEARTDREG